MSQSITIRHHLDAHYFLHDVKHIIDHDAKVAWLAVAFAYRQSHITVSLPEGAEAMVVEAIWWLH